MWTFKFVDADWLISFYNFLFSYSIYPFKKWLQKFVKKKSHQKKTTPHLSWTREDRCIQRHLQLFSLLVKVSSLTNHHGFQYLISEVTCCLHPFATLVENRIYLNWKKKTIKIIEYNLSHKKFVTRVESVFWMSEWKQNPFPTRKKLWMDLPFIKNVHINHPESWIILSLVLSCTIRTSGELTWQWKIYLLKLVMGILHCHAECNQCVWFFGGCAMRDPWSQRSQCWSKHPHSAFGGPGQGVTTKLTVTKDKPRPSLTNLVYTPQH